MAEVDSIETVGPALPSAREREVVRLLMRGLTIREIAIDLDISVATLRTHLQNIRAKLGARTTAQALVISERFGWTSAHPGHVAEIEPLADKDSFLSDLASGLRDCVSFDEAWRVLNAQLATQGVESVNFGLMAEPVGTFTNGAHLIGMSLPGELRDRYERAGGAMNDLFFRATAMGAGAILALPDVPLPECYGLATREFRDFQDGLCDHGTGLTLGVNTRDTATGAPFAIAWNIPRGNVADLRRRQRACLALNRDVGDLFFRIVQNRRLLRDRVALSVRQREALQNAARGFTTAESANRMGISTRALEKLLARARAELGAATTSSAIYRALVFRALA